MEAEKHVAYARKLHQLQWRVYYSLMVTASFLLIPIGYNVYYETPFPHIDIIVYFLSVCYALHFFVFFLLQKGVDRTIMLAKSEVSFALEKQTPTETTLENVDTVPYGEGGRSVKKRGREDWS